MYVRWQARPSSTPWRRRQSRGRWSAILAEAVRRSGKPRQQYIAFLGSFEQEQLLDPEQADSCRVHFWDRVTERLDELGNRVSSERRQRIETALAKKVPPPTPEQREAVDRRWRDDGAFFAARKR
jgi:hypothetical protein